MPADFQFEVRGLLSDECACRPSRLHKAIEFSSAGLHPHPGLHTTPRQGVTSLCSSQVSSDASHHRHQSPQLILQGLLKPIIEVILADFEPLEISPRECGAQSVEVGSPSNMFPSHLIYREQMHIPSHMRSRTFVTCICKARFPAGSSIPPTQCLSLTSQVMTCRPFLLQPAKAASSQTPIWSKDVWRYHAFLCCLFKQRRYALLTSVNLRACRQALRAMRALQAECTLCLASAQTADRSIIGLARLRLRAQQEGPQGMCAIWQCRPQALPLRSPATGAQTAVTCISVHLVQRMPGWPGLAHLPLASPSQASLAQTFLLDL